MSRYPAKADHLSEILNLYPDQERWCAGYAPSQGRRCHNPISGANRGSAVRLLDEGSERMRQGEDIDDLLMDLASLVLCRHVHQKDPRSQVPTLVKKWQEKIWGVSEDLEKVKHLSLCRDTDEVEIPRRLNRSSFSSRLQPSWHENLPLQSSVEAPNSSKVKVNRRARPSSSNDGTTRRARVSSAGVSGAITTTSSQHAVSITEQPGLFTAPAPTLHASTSSSPSSSQSSGSSPSRPAPLPLSTSNPSPTISTPMVNPRATVTPASSSHASATTSMSASTSASTSIASSITSPTSARASPNRATTSGSGHTETAFSRVPASSPRGSAPSSRHRTHHSAQASRSDTTTTTSVTSTRTITVSTSSSTSTAAPTTSTPSPRVSVSSVEPEASASAPTDAPARSRTASTTVTPAVSTSAPTNLASTSTTTATTGASSTSSPTFAPTAAPTVPAQTATATTTTSQPDTSSPAVISQPPRSSSSSSISSTASAVSVPSPLVPKPTYTPTRQPITGDCSICYEPLLPDSPFTTPHQAARDLSIVYCKQQCGTNFHFSCMFTWKKTASQMGREPTCPMCRAAWS